MNSWLKSKNLRSALNLIATMKTMSVFALILFIVACGSNSNQTGNPQLNWTPTEFGQVLSTWPAEGQTNVVRDPTIRIVFSTTLDAASAFDFNYQIWTSSGEHVGAEKLIGSRLVTDPTDASKKVTEISIRLRDTLLTPGIRYTVTWASPLSSNVNQNSDINPALIGLMTTDLQPVVEGGFSFEVGSSVSAMQAGSGFRVLSSSPGQLINRMSNTDIYGSLTNAFNPFSNRYAIATNARTPIRINFSHPLARIPGVDQPSGPLGEIQSIPLQNFPGVVVGVFDQNTNFAAVFSQAAIDINSIHSLYNNRINGNLSTENGRRTLVFRPSEDYPNNPLKYVVYMVGQLRGDNNAGFLSDVVNAGGFIHSSGVSFNLPFMNGSIQNFLNGGGE